MIYKVFIFSIALFVLFDVLLELALRSDQDMYLDWKFGTKYDGIKTFGAWWLLINVILGIWCLFKFLFL